MNDDGTPDIRGVRDPHNTDVSRLHNQRLSGAPKKVYLHMGTTQSKCKPIYSAFKILDKSSEKKMPGNSSMV